MQLANDQRFAYVCLGLLGLGWFNEHKQTKGTIETARTPAHICLFVCLGGGAVIVICSAVLHVLTTLCKVLHVLLNILTSLHLGNGMA